MTKSAITQLVLIIIYFHFCSISCVVILRDNGYEGLTWAIHPSVSEDPSIIQNIMDLMTSASEVLYSATHQRAFFRDVTIIVPSSWSQVYNTVSRGGGRFGMAEVRIDRTNPAYGNIPYTHQMGGCGEPGQYIHFTPEFILELHGVTKEEFGEPVGRTFIHEWSHLRYGVFDEYGNSEDERTPPVYVDDNGQVQLTGCAKDMEGTLKGPDGQPCTSDTQDCVYKVDLLSSRTTSSLMYLPFLLKADGFCGDSEDRPHNDEAPNAQNLMCQGKSTWEIIFSHPDFAEGKNPRNLNLNTRPRFRVYQPKKADNGFFVLLLDVSGSMTGSRIEMLRSSAARFIYEQIPEGSRLGIISFSDRPMILSNVTLITEESREQLVSVLPTRDDGGSTAIGASLQTAIEMLNSSQNMIEGSVIILITDGEENVAPYIRTVVPELTTSKAIVNTVAFGRYASSQLESLVKVTGGRGFFYGDEDINFPRHDSALESAFFESMSTQADVELRPVEVFKTDATLKANGEITATVFIDEEASKNVKFNFGYIRDALNVTLVDPNGDTYNRDSEVFHNDPISRTFTFHLPTATAGQWTYTIKGQKGVKQGLGITVTSEPIDVREQPIRIKARMNDIRVNFPEDAAKAKIYAEVFKGYLPVLDALVVSTVERPIGSPVEVLLKDDGAGPDIVANDGIYTAFFAQYNGTGRYSVTARVVNDGRARLKVMSQGMDAVHSASMSRKMFAMSMKKVSKDHTILLGSFQRTANAGSFRVSGWIANADVIPPNRVMDLRATKVDDVIDLMWTSPGDDLDQGTATRLEIRFHKRFASLVRQFENGNSIGEDDLFVGSWKPMTAGHEQKVRFRLSKEHYGQNVTLHFATRFYDESGNPSEVSNVASVFPSLKFQRTTAITREETITFTILAATLVSSSLAISSMIFFLLFISNRKSVKYNFKGDTSITEENTTITIISHERKH